MNRADRLEEALRDIVHMTNGPREDRHWWTIQRMAQAALDLDYPWPGDAPDYYSAPEDAKLAHEWTGKHARADELIFVKQRPFMAVYYEPVAEHYQQARQRFREFCEAFREARELEW